MLIIPAIDIKNSCCVRLTQGKEDSATVYYKDPVEAALFWQGKGAKYLHIVDLDGAFKGRTVNFHTIEKLLSRIDMQAEIGGGIRTSEDIERYLNKGADRVILGTQALADFNFLKETVKKIGKRIAVAVDTVGSKAAIEGWGQITSTSGITLAQKAVSAGVETIIYTDITVDGTLKGPNFSGIEEFINSVSAPNIIISGGISSMGDIEKLKKLGQKGIKGIIIGRALYTGKIKGDDLWNG